MSEEFYDSKGIKHFSRTTAESANEKYLAEEREHRKQTADAAADAAWEASRIREASEAAAKEARLQREATERLERQAEIDAKMADRHAAEMEVLKGEELRLLRDQNQFERDILYLTHEAPSDRKAYVIKRVAKEHDIEAAEENLRDTINETLDRVLPNYEKDIAQLRALFHKRREIVVKKQELAQTMGNLIREREEIENIQESRSGAWGCLWLALLVGTVALGLFFYGINIEGQPGSGDGSGTAAALVISAMCAVLAVVVGLKARRQKRRLAERYQQCGGDPIHLSGQMRSSQEHCEQWRAANELQIMVLGYRILHSLHRDCTGPVNLELRALRLTKDWFLEKFWENLNVFQSRFPQSLRVQQSDISKEDLHELYLECVGDSLSSATSRQILAYAMHKVPELSEAMNPIGDKVEDKNRELFLRFMRVQWPKEGLAWNEDTPFVLGHHNPWQYADVQIQTGHCDRQAAVSIVGAIRRLKPYLSNGELTGLTQQLLRKSDGACEVKMLTIILGVPEQEAKDAEKVLKAAGASTLIKESMKTVSVVRLPLNGELDGLLNPKDFQAKARRLF